MTATPCTDTSPVDCIAAAEEDYTALRYAKAGLRAETLLGDDVPAFVRVRAHRLLGQVDAITGETAQAEEHFLSMLLLDEDARIPANVSPKISGPFERALARAKDERERQSPPARAPDVSPATKATAPPLHPKPPLAAAAIESAPSRSAAPTTGAEDEGLSPVVVAGVAVGAGAVLLVAAAAAAGTTAAVLYLSRPTCDASLGCVDAP